MAPRRPSESAESGGHRQRRAVPAHTPWRRRRRRRRLAAGVATGNRPGLGAPPPVAQAPAFGGATGPVATARARRERRRRRVGLEALLADPAVTQILLTAPDAALVDRGSGLSLLRRQPRRSERGRRRAVALRQHRLSAAAARQSGRRRAPAGRHARLGGLPARLARPAWWHRSAGRAARAGARRSRARREQGRPGAARRRGRGAGETCS